MYKNRNNENERKELYGMVWYGEKICPRAQQFRCQKLTFLICTRGRSHRGSGWARQMTGQDGPENYIQWRRTTLPTEGIDELDREATFNCG